MKKLLGVSIMAMLVVTPMMANAALPNATTVPVGNDTGANPTVDAAYATAGYVKGAYNAIQTEIQGIVGDIDVTTDGDIIKANKSVVQNLQALESEITALSGSTGAQNATFSPTSGNGLESNTIGGAINEVQGEINTLNGGADDTGSVANTVKTQAADADFEADGMEATNIGDAIVEAKGDADAAAAAAADAATAVNTLANGAVATNTENIATNTSKISGLAAKQISYVDTWGATSATTVTLGALPPAPTIQ